MMRQYLSIFLICIFFTALSGCITSKSNVGSSQTTSAKLAKKITVSAETSGEQKSDSLSVQEVLILEQGWKREFFGPVGQSYAIDIGADGRSILTLHPLVSGTTEENIETPVCSLFESGRLMTFSSEVFQDYSEDDAKAARNNFFLKGQSAVKEADWLLMDKLAWLTYVAEGFQSHGACVDESTCRSTARKYFDQPLTIESCGSHHTTARSKSEIFTFPNLILTMPQYLYLSSSEPSSTKDETKSEPPIEEFFGSLEKDAEAIARSFMRLSDSNRLNGLSLVQAYAKVFDQDISMENRIFLGSLCSLEALQDTCDETVLMLIEAEQANVILDMLRESLEVSDGKKVAKRVEAIDVTHFGRQYKLPLPQGFCDASGTEISHELFELLNARRVALPMLPIHYFVFTECEPEYGAIGYVALTNLDKITSTSQSDFNAMTWRNFTSQIREMLNTADAPQKSVLRQIDFSQYGLRRPDIIIDGPNNSINVAQIVDVYDGQTIREFTFTAGTVLPGAVAYYYITVVGDGFGYEIGADKWVDILDRNSVKLKRIN